MLQLAEALADAADGPLPPLEAVQGHQAALLARLRLNPAWLAEHLVDPASLADEAAMMR